MTNLMRPKMYEFRQIDDDRIAFMFSLINALLSRIFWQKCVRVNFRNLHTVGFCLYFGSAVCLQFICLQFGYLTCKW